MMKMDKTYKTRDYGNIFRLIYAMKRCTRQQIAEKLSISLPTVTHNLNLLTQRGLVYNSGAHHATGGRKANLYQCVADSRLALGIDITRRHLSLVLINLELQIVDKKRIRCAFQDSDAYFAHMGRELTEILSKNGVDGGRLLGVGVSMPVIVNSDQKSISYAEVINVGENLYERMAAHIPYPFLLFNDANSAGLAESWVSDSSGDMTYLFLSASVGGGLHDRQAAPVRRKPEDGGVWPYVHRPRRKTLLLRTKRLSGRLLLGQDALGLHRRQPGGLF